MGQIGCSVATCEHNDNQNSQCQARKINVSNNLKSEYQMEMGAFDADYQGAQNSSETYCETFQSKNMKQNSQKQ